MRGVLFAVFTLLLSPAASQAWADDTYCRTSQYTVLGDGGSSSLTWYVTTASARRVQTAMQTRPTVGCSWSFNTVGGMPRAPQILTPPHLGKIDFPTRYRVFYRADRPGSDAFDLKFFWLGRTGQPQSGTVHFDVAVTPGPI